MHEIHDIFFFFFFFFWGGGGGSLSDQISIFYLFIYFWRGGTEQMLGPSLCVGKIQSTPMGIYYEISLAFFQSIFFLQNHICESF